MTTLRKNAVTFHGEKFDLEGPELKVGDKAPTDFVLTRGDMTPTAIKDYSKNVRIIATVPSLDTSVCDLEARRFNEEAAKIPNVKIITVSMDLPFALGRWCAAAGIDKVLTLSDYKERNFARAWGVWVPAMALLTRAVFVVDREETIRYVQYVPEMTHHPDYEKAIEAVRRLG